jgi:hypothetical protein
MTITTVMISSCLVGCVSNQPKQELSSNNVEVWSCDASIKVLQNFIDEKTGKTLPISEGYYDDIKQEPNITITMLRGEYESGQVIISPDVDVEYYNATISDLKLVGGDAVISAKDNNLVLTFDKKK